MSLKALKERLSKMPFQEEQVEVRFSPKPEKGRTDELYPSFCSQHSCTITLDKLYSYVYNNGMDEVFLTTLKCQRCGHIWIPRKPQMPQTCSNPKCRSPYWQTKRWKGVKK